MCPICFKKKKKLIIKIFKKDFKIGKKNFKFCRQQKKKTFHKKDLEFKFKIFKYFQNRIGIIYPKAAFSWHG